MNAPYSPPRPAPWVDPAVTADGAPRAKVAFRGYEMLWVNTGTLCNLACATCYIESSPSNDRLAYFEPSDLAPLLDELETLGPQARIGFTGGEPFLNPHMIALAEAPLQRGREVLILTNAMRPMRRPAMTAGLRRLRETYGDALRLRVSIDHYTAAVHDAERGPDAFAAACEGLQWLAREGFAVAVAGRAGLAESEADARAGYAGLFADLDVAIDLDDTEAFVLFPDMDEAVEAPEITEACWDKVGAAPDAMMCAGARMAVKRRGADQAVLLPCTLIAYEERVEMGPTLAGATGDTTLNHPFCAQFCVLGGASCAG